MKKILLASVALVWGGAALATTPPDPANLPGGLSGKNIIHDSTSTFNGQTVTSALNGLNTTSSNAVPKAWIGANTTSSVTGVAPLDASGNSTSTILTTSGKFGPTINGGVVPLFDAYTSNSAIGGGYESTQIGGHGITLSNSPYGSSAAQPGSLNIFSNPSGPYNGGCGLCLFSEPRSGLLAAISGVDYRTGATTTHDGVMMYENPVNTGARLILNVASYTSSSVTLSTALTANEASQLMQGEYIITNSVPSGTTQTAVGTSGTLPTFYNIGGYVKDVSSDLKTIDVYGWGLENGTSGLTPSTTSLDTVWDPNRTTPVVYVGALTKLFKENTYMVYDGSRGGQGSSVGTSLIHNQELGEYDFQVSNLNRDYEVSQHGYTFTSDASSPTQLSDDSYFLALAGGMRTYITMSPQWWTTPIDSDPLYVGSLEGSDYSTGSQKVLTSWAQSTNTGSNSFTDFHYIRPAIWTTRNVANSTNYTDSTVSFGINIDGSRTTPNATQERVDFNPKAYPNGVSLCGYSVCGLSVDGSGNSHADGNLTVTGTTNLGTYTTIDAAGYGGNYSPVVVGAPPSGYVAALQVAAESGFGNDFIEFFNGTTEAAKIDYAGNLTLSGGIASGGNVTVADTKSLGMLGSDGQMGAYEYLTDATSSSGALLHLVVAPKNGVSGTVYVDGKFATGAEAQLSSANVVGDATVGGALTVSGDINLASGKSVNFCDGSSRCSYLHSTQYANATISPYSGNYGGAYVAGSFTLSNLPTADDDGAQVWCSDCKLNGITGVAAYWHASASKWTDSQNGTLAN